MSKKEVLLNYEKRMKEIQEMQPGKDTDVNGTVITERTEVIVQLTGKFTMQRPSLPLRHTNFV
mgnify:CR=1 FL=1